MTLWDILSVTTYYQKFLVYVTNNYDQNIPVGKGDRSELLDEDKNEELFWHLQDEIDHISLTSKGEIVVRVRDKNYLKRAEELYSESYVKRWDNLKLETRPWLHSAELPDFNVRWEE